MESGSLTVKALGRGTAWFDTGTHESLLEASTFVSIVQKRQNIQIACLEEIAWRMGYIDEKQLMSAADIFAKTDYGLYLRQILESNVI